MQLNTAIGFEGLVVSIFNNEIQFVVRIDVIPFARNPGVRRGEIGPRLKRDPQGILLTLIIVRFAGMIGAPLPPIGESVVKRLTV